jgi:hypothetical protein
MTMNYSRLLVFLQLPLTLAILVIVPGNLLKTALLVLLWAVTFQRLNRAETVYFGFACFFFTLMNVASLKQGIFRFQNPDIIGLPYYEFFMWGFYLLHSKRLIGGAAPEKINWKAIVIAVLYSVSFSTIQDQSILLLATGTLLAIALLIFHETGDLAHTAYLIVLGAAIEYTGVASSQWSYPSPPPGGVPLWFITLWGGVGLLARRLALPKVQEYERRHVAHKHAVGKDGH